MEDLDDNETVALEHDRLFNATSKLYKTHYITTPRRKEPATVNKKINTIKYNTKCNLHTATKILGTTAHGTELSKKLSLSKSKVFPKPLEKPQAERIKRATSYEQTKKKVGRWNPVVARNRTVDSVTFPIKYVKNKLQPTDEFIKKFELKSELEKELEEIDPLPPVEGDDEEEEQIYPISYEDMLEHRRQIAKFRATQSYKAAKAKRQGKIKSKKYHRILKKEKLKQQLKEFEELQKTNPEEALEKLQALEKARALERHTLRHKNTGKWAKSKMIRAKYDKEVRQQLSEQLAVSRGLTTKIQDDSTDESEDNENVLDISLSQDPMNPWAMKKSSIDTEFEFGYKKYVNGRMLKIVESDSNTDEDKPNETNNYSKVHNNLDIIKNEKDQKNVITYNYKNKEVENELLNTSAIDKTVPKMAANNKTSKSKLKSIQATTNWIVEPINIICKKNKKPLKDISTNFDAYENKLSKELEKKLNKLKNSIENFEIPSPKVTKVEDQRDTLEYLQFKNKKLKAIIDEELIESVHKNAEEHNDKNSSPAPLNVDNLSTELNTHSVLNKEFKSFPGPKPKHLDTAMPEDEIGMDDLDDDDDQVVPKYNFEEGFEADDVVASFRKEKEDEINKNNPQDIDCTLPGWGSWGGKGVKAPKRKRNRFILKAPTETTHRRDENKGDIIITEYKDPKLALHKLTDIPFPFQSIKEYEASIRAPIGNTFISEKAHQKLIKPNVITRAGTIIEPMDEDELLVKRNCTFKNMNVIKILAKK